jgi:hypothetical protein
MIRSVRLPGDQCLNSCRSTIALLLVLITLVYCLVLYLGVVRVYVLRADRRWQFDGTIARCTVRFVLQLAVAPDCFL